VVDNEGGSIRVSFNTAEIVEDFVVLDQVEFSLVLMY